METIRVINEFVESCRQSERVFQKWIDHCALEHIRSNFSEMAEILRCVQTAIEKAEKIKNERR